MRYNRGGWCADAACGRSSTDVLLELDATPLTAHVAAPVELAAAPLDDDPSTRLEAAAAAHELAAVGPGRRAVAQAAARAQRPRAAVRLAEVGRRGHEDEVGGRGRPEAGVAGDQLASGPAASLHHLDGSVELVAERGADVAELGHRAPARLELARPRHPVALALHSHEVLDRLHKAHPTKPCNFTHATRSYFSRVA